MSRNRKKLEIRNSLLKEKYENGKRENKVATFLSERLPAFGETIVVDLTPIWLYNRNIQNYLPFREEYLTIINDFEKNKNGNKNLMTLLSINIDQNYGFKARKYALYEICFNKNLIIFPTPIFLKKDDKNEKENKDGQKIEEKKEVENFTILFPESRKVKDMRKVIENVVDTNFPVDVYNIIIQYLLVSSDELGSLLPTFPRYSIITLGPINAQDHRLVKKNSCTEEKGRLEEL
jgi:hypothetical protein